MNRIGRLLLVVAAIHASVAAHGTNWSKLFLSGSDNRLSIQLHISEQNIARLSQVKNRNMSVADLLEIDRSFIISRIWKNIHCRVDGVKPGEMIDSGFSVIEKQPHPVSETFHSHSRMVHFWRTWSIPDTAFQAAIGFHLFSKDGIDVKWLILAGARGNRKTLIASPGETIAFNFINNSFVQVQKPVNRFLPLWIAFGIGGTIIVGASGIYLLVVMKRKRSRA